MNTKARRITVLTAVIALAGLIGWWVLVRDHTGGQSDFCALHRAKMNKIFVPISYGLPSMKLRLEWSFAAVLFPHAAVRSGGGCSPEAAQWARLYRCPECYAARQQWLERWNKLTEPEQMAEVETFAEKQRKVSSN